MSFRTKFFTMLPWIGGINTSLDPSVIKPNQLTRGEHLIFATNGARNMRDGTNYNWDSSTANNGVQAEGIIGGIDFWYGSSGTRTNFLMGLGSSGNLYQWNKTTGIRSLIPLNSTATAWPSNNTICSFEVMNNSLIYAGDGVGNLPRIYIPSASSSATDLAGGPPKMSVVRQYQSRIWSDDRTLLDRLNYSPPGDPQTWGGNGDSGALDVGVGDGDPVGITAILPPFQKQLFIGKQTKLYTIAGNTPESYDVDIISNAIGVVSHNAAVAVDQDDIIFVSLKGIHSLIGTIKYGDDESKYLSKDIQKTINQKWTLASFKKIWGCYLSQINSVAFAVPDTTYSGSGNTAIWLYNIPLSSWYVWPNIDCQCLFVSNDIDKQRFYIGTGSGRLAKTFNGTNYDISVAGINTAITMTIATGVIYLDQNPMIVNGMKRFTLIWGPQGTVNVTVTIKIDNYSAQPLNFNQNFGSALLGSTFILGTSVLGTTAITGPFSQTIDGYGRSIQATFIQSGQQAAINFQGFAVEYEPLGPASETILSG